PLLLSLSLSRLPPTSPPFPYPTLFRSRIAVVVRCGHQPSKRQEERQRATLPTANTSVAPTSVRVESARQPCEPPAEGSTCGLPIWNSPRLGHSAVQQYRTRRVPAPWRVPTTDAFGGAVS